MPALARLLSVIGHPLVVMSLAAWIALGSGTDPRAWLPLLLAIAVVLVYSFLQVRRGRWLHIDAVQPGERRGLNLFLLALFCALAALAWWRGFGHAALLPALAAAIIGCALLTERYCKLSLHLAFAVYAALVFATVHPVPGIIAALLAVAVGWSRLRLGRHVSIDLVAGALAGSGAGLAYWYLTMVWRML